ncbi:RHS repeat-associated core domain-containing protein [Sorangium sp. So ce1000]|uniref:RHS repeat-associated core domain-containing protein n=1 Tax=Sorangium sp. So ce1000 TaxID=3133325 RepID=UPI003F636881
MGNLRRMVHQAGTGSWTRWYAYEETANNRLTSTTGDPENGPFRTYAHDAHGNMTSMPHITALTWDENDQVRSTDLDGGGDVYYDYDAAGQRVRKVWEHNGLVDERIYLGGYEVYRRRNSSGLVLERQTLHVMDGARRVAMVETKTVDTSGPFTVTPRVRYQLDNHLGSASLEVDGAGLVIGYEEYHPYGTTAYWSAASGIEVSQRRYRYTGKEKDEETGLYYHGARYYAPWLGRWTSADPAGMVDGPVLYNYVRGNPVRLTDPNGKESATDKQIAQMTDVQLHRHLAGLSPEARASFAGAATGNFAERAWATLNRGGMGIGYSLPADAITTTAPNRDSSNANSEISTFDERFYYAVPGRDGRPVPKPLSAMSDDALLALSEGAAFEAFRGRQAEARAMVGEAAERYEHTRDQLVLTAAEAMPLVGTGLMAARALDPEVPTSTRILSGAGALLSVAPLVGAGIRGAAGEGAAPLRFAHGTSPASAQSITRGLSAEAAAANTKGGTALTPGSFFAHEIGPPSAPGEGLQLAYEWGLRHSPTPAVVIGELPGPVAQELLKSGGLRVLDVPGMPGVQQLVFDPGAFSVVNQNVTWLATLRP